MNDQNPSPTGNKTLYLKITIFLQVLIAVGLIWFAVRGDWENVFLTLLVMILTLLPTIVRRWSHLVIPPEFQLVAVAFIFLSLFLGSAADFYYRYWWWDVVLHTGSGFLLGIVGFLALFLLNNSNQIPQGMKNRFICFFAVTFAVFLGVVWEIVEFTVDRIWPTVNMQSTETGVRDTMWDLIVDTLGAIVVAAMGGAYLRTGRYSFIADGVRNFVRENPSLFKQTDSDQEPKPQAD